MKRSLTVNSTKFWLTIHFMGLDESVYSRSYVKQFCNQSVFGLLDSAHNSTMILRNVDFYSTNDTVLTYRNI